MACDEFYALGHQVIGNSHRLLGIATIIGNLKDKLLAIDPARGIDVGHRAAHALAQLLSKGRILAFQGANGCDENVS